MLSTAATLPNSFRNTRCLSCISTSRRCFTKHFEKLPGSAVINALTTEASTAAAYRESDTSRRLLLKNALLTSLALTVLTSNKDAVAKSSILSVAEGPDGGRDIATLASGIEYSDVAPGSGDIPKSGDLVMVDIVGTLDNGKVFLNTRTNGTPLAIQLGITNKFVPEGLLEVLQTMHEGGNRLAVVPSSLGYADKGVNLPQGNVPPNAKLFYDIELLRCQRLNIGLACCTEQKYPCLDDNAIQMLQQTAEQLGSKSIDTAAPAKGPAGVIAG